jgi:hypothetical protein
MAFYLGRGAAFWKPSDEGLPDTDDALAHFPSEPDAPTEELRRQDDPLTEGVGPWTDLEGLALQLSQTCGRIEELADRTEDMLRRVERLAADTTVQLHANAGRPSEPAWWRSLRARAIAEARADWMIARMKFAHVVRLPLRQLAARLRKRFVMARVSTAMRAETMVNRLATAGAAHHVAPPVTVVIRAPRAASVADVPAIMSVSAAVTLAAAVSLLVLTERVPSADPALPTVAAPQLAMTLPLRPILDMFVEPTSVRPPIVQAPVAPAVSAPKAVPVRLTEPRGFVGTLLVESEPEGASVFINQERVGETPLRLPELRAGSRVVWVESNGYQRWSAGVLVPANKITTINVKLQRDQQ